MKILNKFTRNSTENQVGGEEYSWMLNFTPNSIHLHENGKVVNTEGNVSITTYNAPNYLRIWEVVELNNLLYAACTGAGGDGVSVYKLEFNADRTRLTYTYIDFSDTLNFDPSTDSLHALGVEETEEVATIYLNIVTETGGELVTAASYTINVLADSPRLYETASTKVLLLPPIVTQVKGQLDQGVYEYAYRLIQKNGAQTAWSHLSAGMPAPLSSGSNWMGFEAIDTIEHYQEAPKSNAGFHVQLPDLSHVSSKFTHAEICQIHYYLPRVSPKVEIKEVFNLNDTTSVTYLNNKTIIAALSVAEFVVPLDTKEAAFTAVFQDRMYKAGLVDNTLHVDESNIASVTTFVTTTSAQEYNSEDGSYKDGNKGTTYVPTKGLQQGSTYRIGVVFIDNAGRYSDVKQVKDYEVPYDTGLAGKDGDRLTIKNLKIVLENIPNNAVQAFLVHVPRQMKDRPIVSVGIGYFSNEYLNTTGNTEGNHLVIFTPEHLIGGVDFSKIDGQIKIKHKIVHTETYHSNQIKLQGTEASSINEFDPWETKLQQVEDAEPLEKSILNRSTSSQELISFIRQNREEITIGEVCSKSLICGTEDLFTNKITVTLPDCGNAVFEATELTGFVFWKGDSMCEIGITWTIGMYEYSVILDPINRWARYGQTYRAGAPIPAVYTILAEATVADPEVDFNDPNNGNKLVELRVIAGAIPPERENSVVQIKQNVIPFGGTATLHSPQQDFVQFSEIKKIGDLVPTTVGNVHFYEEVPAVTLYNPFNVNIMGPSLITLEPGKTIQDFPLEDYLYIVSITETFISLFILESGGGLSLLIRSTVGDVSGQSYQDPVTLDRIYLHVPTVEDIKITSLITTGDTYVDYCAMQLQSRARTDEAWTFDNGDAVYAVVPIESSVNPRMVGDSLLDLISKKSNVLKHLDYKDNTKISYNVNNAQQEYNLDSLDLYTANSLYSSIDTIRQYKIVPDIVDSSTHFPNMAKYSERKYLGEFVNSFLLYKTNNFTNISSKYGKITNMIVFQERLILFQERALHRLRVNEVSQTVDTSGTMIALGAGDIIGSAGGKVSDIVATEVGCTFHSNIIRSKSSLYWLDSNNRHIYRWLGGNEQPQAISLLTGIADLFYNVITTSTKLLGEYDAGTGNVYLTVQNKASDGKLSQNNELIITHVHEYDVGTDNYTVDIMAQAAYHHNSLDSRSTTLTQGDIITLDINGNETVVRVDELDSTDEPRQIYFRLITGTLPVVGDKINLISHMRYLNNFTIVYNELSNSFTHLLSLYPRQYFHFNKDMFSIPFNSESTYVGALLWKHTQEVRNSFYDILYPGNLRFIINAGKMYAWKSMKMVTEFHSYPYYNSQYNMQGSINKTFSYIKIKKLHKSTDMVKLKPMLNELAIDSIRTEIVDGREVTYRDDPNPIQPEASLLRFIKEATDVDIAHTFNLQRQDDYWIVQFPLIRTMPYDTAGISPELGPEGREFFEEIRSEFIEVSLFYFPANDTDKLTLNKIL